MGLATDPLAIQGLRSRLLQLSMQVATATTRMTLARALGDYIATANKLADAVQPELGAAQVAAPYVPGGSVVTAAVGGTGTIGNRSAAG